MSDLAEFLADLHQEPTDPDERERWRIEHDDVADWALRKLAAIRAEQQRLKDQAAVVIDNAKRWLDQSLSPLLVDERFFEGNLIDYHQRLRESGAAGKTYKLPGGTLKATKEQDDVLYPTEGELGDLFVASLVERGRFDLLKLSPSRSAIKDAVLKDGESLPFVEAVRSEDDVYTNRYSVVVAS